MKKTGTTRLTLEPGQAPPPGDTDWDRVRAMSDAEVRAAALADPDAQPLTREQLARMRRPVAREGQVRAVRQRLGMTQEQFAEAFRLPIGTVRDWEQGRSEPDAPARALLRVIEREPDAARRALDHG